MRAFAILILSFFFFETAMAQVGVPSPLFPDVSTFTSPENAIPLDIDKDGDLDIISSSSSSSSSNIVWFENIDNEYETYRVIYSFPDSGSIDLQIADLDHDNDVDLLVLFNDEIFWFKNMGGTSFFDGPLPVLSATGEINKVTIVDLNTDGFLDLVLLKGESELGWLASIDGIGNFGTYELLYESVGSPAVDAMDFDNDGDQDIILQNLSDSLLLLENVDAIGNFEERNAFGFEPDSIVKFKSVDIDLDGDLDIVPVVYNPGPIYWYENNNSAQQFLSADTLLPEMPSLEFMDVDFDDFDGDGDLDAISLNKTGGSGVKLSIYEHVSLEGGLEYGSTLFHSLIGIADVNIVDFDFDGLTDLIVTNRNDYLDILSQILMFRSRGGVDFDDPQAGFNNPIDIRTDADRASSSSLSTIDLNEDGFKDILYTSSSGGESYARKFWMQYDSISQDFKNPRYLRPGGQSQDLSLVDLDNDGDKDLLVRGLGFVDDVVIWYEKIDGEDDYEEGIVLSLAKVRSSVSAEDINSDGLLDITYCGRRLKAGAAFYDYGFFWCKNMGNGIFEEALFVESSDGFASFSHAIDFDSDGDIDFLIGKDYEHGIYWLENIDGQGTFEINEIQNDIYMSSYEKFLVDLNKDGLEDFLFVASAGIQLWVRAINNPSTFELQYSNSFPALGSAFDLHFVDLVDLDVDGDLDIVMHHGDSLFMFNNVDGLGTFSDIEPFPGDNKKYQSIAFGEFGRERPDMVAYYPQSENIFILENLLSKTILQGEVYYDLNENGIKELGELPLYNQKIEIQPEAKTTVSSINGNFFFDVDDGEFEIICHPAGGFKLTSPQNISVQVSDSTSAYESFGLIPDTNLVSCQLTLVSAPTRCGFEVPFWLDYQNIGTLITDGTVRLKLDSLVSVSSVFPMPDSTNGSYLFWNFENLFPTYSQSISLVLQMPDVSFIGENILMKTAVFSENESGTLLHTYYHFYESEINCAYDPNDKMVEPNIPNQDNYTLIGDTLNYTVRFQNTGTDTAFTVVVEDYLDFNLVWDELEIIATSHDFNSSLDMRTGRLLFTFDDILLPDSTTNEVASHGFVTFRIPSSENLSEFTIIDNSAGIFFDFNPPILTNSVQNIMVSEFPLLLTITSPACAGDSTGRVEVVFDNPFFESYTWSNGQIGLVADSLTAGFHELSITKIDGTVLDTMIYLFDPDPIEIETLNIENASCYYSEDGAISVRANGGSFEYDYAWNNGSIGSEIDLLSPGIYTLTLTDDFGCVVEKDFNIASPENLVLNIITTVASNNEDDGTAIITPAGGVPPYSYFWESFPMLTDSLATNLAVGSFNVEVTDANNCMTDTSFVITTVSEVQSTLKEDTALDVIPNPSNGNLTINYKLPFAADWKIELLNSLGQIILTQNNLDLKENSWKVNLSPGVYFARLSLNGITKTTKEIIVF